MLLHLGWSLKCRKGLQLMTNNCVWFWGFPDFWKVGKAGGGLRPGLLGVRLAPCAGERGEPAPWDCQPAQGTGRTQLGKQLW